MCIQRLFVLIAVFALTGCITTSAKPLSAVGAEPLDLALVGSWRGIIANEPVYFHIGKESEQQLRMVFISVTKEHKLDKDEYVGHNTTLDGKHYLNILAPDSKQPTTSYIFVSYTRDAKHLTLRIADSEVLKNAIQSGQLAGKIEPGERFAGALITEDAAKLRRYMSEHAAHVFGEPINLRRE